MMVKAIVPFLLSSNSYKNFIKIKGIFQFMSNYKIIIMCEKDLSIRVYKCDCLRPA
ncbi:MAG: hypothetical protein ACFWT2_11590 [Thermoanaerobacterium thermosaccharolyticum]|jgi:hypothetical protein